MNIIEEIHQYLTDTKANCAETHSGEPEYFTIESPINCRTIGMLMWRINLWWDHHDGEILIHTTTHQSLEAAGKEMLDYLKQRGNPEFKFAEDHSHEL